MKTKKEKKVDLDNTVDVLKSNDFYRGGLEEWHKRVEEPLKAKRNWQFISMGLVFINVIALAGLIFFAMQPKLVTRYIEVDKVSGKTQFLNATQTTKLSPSIVNAHVKNYVKALRTVSSDRQIRNEHINTLLNSTLPYSVAEGKVKEYLLAKNPHTRSLDEAVYIRFSREPLPLSDKTYQIEWEEFTRVAGDGELINGQNFKAVVTTEQVKDVSQTKLILNPLAIYIKEINWSKEL